MHIFSSSWLFSASIVTVTVLPIPAWAGVYPPFGVSPVEAPTPTTSPAQPVATQCTNGATLQCCQTWGEGGSRELFDLLKTLDIDFTKTFAHIGLDCQLYQEQSCVDPHCCDSKSSLLADFGYAGCLVFVED